MEEVISHNFDEDFLDVSQTSASAISLMTEGGKSDATISRSSRSKTGSKQLSFPEILDKLEEAIDDADRIGGKEVDRQKNSARDYSGVVKFMESQPLPTGMRGDISETLGVLELFEKYETDIAAQKAQITRLQCEKTKLSTELENIKVHEKRISVKYLRDVKSFQNQIETLQTTLQASEAEKSDSKSKEGDYLQKISKLEEKVRTLQRSCNIRAHSNIVSSQNSKPTPIEKDKINEDEKKRRECLEARIAELGNRVKEYEAKEKLMEAQKSERDSEGDITSLKEQLASQANLANSLKEELVSTKSKQADFVKEKGLADFRIRELQQELTLSRPPNKKENGNDKKEELISLKKQVALLKTNLKNAESKYDNLQHKDNENQKSARKLQAQVRTLQRILYSKDPSSLPPTNSKVKNEKSSETDSQNERQKFLENRVNELENQLKHHLGSKQDRFEVPPKTECGAGDMEENSSSSGDKLISELRGRLISQMQLVTCLKENLVATKTKEADWLKEKELLEFRIRELKEQLVLAKTLGKPENQILADLTETVQNLNSRYFYREKELDHLMRRLSLNSLSSSCLPRPHFPIMSMSSSGATNFHHNGQIPLGLLLGNGIDYNSNALPSSAPGDLSPNTTLQLLRGSMDDFLLLS